MNSVRGYLRRLWAMRIAWMAELRLRQNPGRIVISLPTVIATFYGPGGIARAVFCYTLLKTPGFVWTDRTHALRNSVRRVYPGNVVVMGNSEAFYAPYVEKWGQPMQQAFRAAVGAIDWQGEVR